jgi:hypothetical protein
MNAHLGTNARLLCEFSNKNGAGVFNKLLIVQTASMLKDALKHIVRQEEIARGQDSPFSVDERTINWFGDMVGRLRRYQVLDGVSGDAYDDLNSLLDLWARASRNEPSALLDDARIWALEFNARVLTHLSERASQSQAPNAGSCVLTIPAS